MGARGERATTSVRGQGSLVALPSLDLLSLPLVVQLQGTHGSCWESRFSSDGLELHAATRLIAKSD